MHVHTPSLLSFPQHSWKHKKRSQQVRSMETFHDHGGTPKWMIYFMENPKIKWMMVPGVPPWLRKPPYILYIHITSYYLFANGDDSRRWDVADVANWLLSSPMDRSSRNLEWVVYLSRVEKLLENQSKRRRSCSYLWLQSNGSNALHLEAHVAESQRFRI